MKKRNLSILLSLLCLASVPLKTSAAPSYWDSNGTTEGAGATPTGIWGTDAFWSADLTGASATGAWTPGDIAVFGAGTDAIGAYTVTLNGTQTAGGINVEEGTVSFDGTGVVALGTTGTITVGAGATLSTDSSARISATAGTATATLNGGTLRSTNPGNAGTFLDADIGIVLGAAGGTFSHTGGLLNIVQTGTKISGEGSLTKDGVGVLAFAMTAGNATYTGGTIVNGGELRMRTVVNTLPTATAMTVNSAGIFNLNGVNTTVGSLSGDGQVGLANGTLTIGGSDVTTFTGTIKDTANAGASGSTSVGGRVVRSGNAGTTILTGNNTYTGGTTKSGTSVLKVGHNNALGTGKLIWSGGTISSDGATARTLTNAVDINGSIIAGHATDNGDLRFQTGAWTITGANRTLTANSAITVDSSIGEDVAGRKLTKAGAGKLTLNGNNTFTGGFQINAGTVAIGHNSAIGSGLLTLNGGTFQGDGAAARVFNNVVSFAAGTTIGGSAPITFQTGAWTLNGNRTLTVNNSEDTTISSAIGEDVAGRSFTKAGTGKLILSGVNTYTGPTTVSAGTLALTGSGSLASGTNIVAADATLDLSGTTSGGMTLEAGRRIGGAGTIVGTVSLASGSTIAPGSSPGTLTTGSQIWEGGATYVFEINNATGSAGIDPGWDLINITGGLTIDATVGDKFNIDINSLTLFNVAGDAANFDTTQNHIFKIATATDGITGFDASKFDIDATAFSNSGPGDWFVSQTGNDLFLNFAPVPEPSTIALGIVGALAFVGTALRRRFRK